MLWIKIREAGLPVYLRTSISGTTFTFVVVLLLALRHNHLNYVLSTHCNRNNTQASGSNRLSSNVCCTSTRPLEPSREVSDPFILPPNGPSSCVLYHLSKRRQYRAPFRGSGGVHALVQPSITLYLQPLPLWCSYLQLSRYGYSLCTMYSFNHFHRIIESHTDLLISLFISLFSILKLSAGFLHLNLPWGLDIS